MHVLLATVALQSLLSFEIEGPEPVRFGVPLPVDAVAQGLRLHGPPGRGLQWRFLQETPGVGADRIWVEIAIDGVESGGDARCRILAGGAGPSDASGEAEVPAYRLHVEETRDDDGWRRVEELRWNHGTVDRRVRERGERFLGGWPRDQTSPGFAGRFLRVRIAESFWRDVGVLPRRDGSGAGLRRELLDALPVLEERAAPGESGRGDYVRGEVVTNLEFDTTLALLRLGLASGSIEALRRGVESARHLEEVDIDPASGLPHRHGPEHRSRDPEAGHVWIEGLQLAGLLTADQQLVDASRTMARSLASRMRIGSGGQGPFDRLRDEAWPLHELEIHLRFEDTEPVRAACDLLAGRILDRWDAGFGALRYGEGESRSGGTYDQRLWLELGIAAVALDLHAHRTGSVPAARVVAELRERAVALCKRGRSGVPIRCRVTASGEVVSDQRVQGAAEAVLMLEGLDPRARSGLLRRGVLRGALEDVLDPRAEDFATRFTIIGRCSWVMR